MSEELKALGRSIASIAVEGGLCNSFFNASASYDIIPIQDLAM